MDSSKISISSSYSTANDSSDDYFLATTFGDEIDDDLDGSRACDFDRELAPTVNGNGCNRIDSTSCSAPVDDDEVMFYFEP